MDIPLFRVYMAPEAISDAGQVLQSGYIGQGERVERFETALRQHFGTPFVSTVNSGTSALHLAIRLLEGQPGDEILTTPLTCTATNWPILANGCRLRWVDVDPDTCNMDLHDLARKLSPRTKAVLVVHWGGYPVDLTALGEILERYANGDRTIPIIEDCAHAFGSRLRGAPIGCHGNICCFSLQAIKLVTSIDGGILITPQEAWHRRAKLLRWYGIDREVPLQDMRCELDILEWGYKFHMNDVCAAVGKANFLHWERLCRLHQENSAYYDSALANVAGVRTMSRHVDHVSSCWLYTLKADGRDELRRCLQQRGIMASRVHERNDKHTCVRAFREPLPQLDQLVNEMLCIPVGWWVSKEQREFIVDTIRQGW